MKYLVILFSILSISLNSCKNSDSKTKTPEAEETQTTVKVKKHKTPEELKEEGKMLRAELTTYFSEIPDNLLFKESLVNARGVKKSVLVAENVSEETKKQLDQWVENQSKELEENNWEKLVLQDNEMISGMLYNSYSFKKAQGGESTQQDMLSLTTVYSADNDTYTIFIKPYVI